MPFSSRKTGIAFSCETLMFLYAFIPSCCCLAQALSDLSVEQWVCCVVCCVPLVLAVVNKRRGKWHWGSLVPRRCPLMPRWCPLMPAGAELTPRFTRAAWNVSAGAARLALSDDAESCDYSAPAVRSCCWTASWESSLFLPVSKSLWIIAFITAFDSWVSFLPVG